MTDLNRDGKLDLVTVNSHPDNDVSVVLGDGRGNFTLAPGSPFAVGPSPYPGTLGDLNGDGHLDIIATTTDRIRKEPSQSRVDGVIRRRARRLSPEPGPAANGASVVRGRQRREWRPET